MRCVRVGVPVTGEAVVEAHHVHLLQHARAHGVVHLVEPLRDGARGVQDVTEVLHPAREVEAVRQVLLGHLVADGPHHDRGMVAVVEDEVREVARPPVREEPRIAVPALRVRPHVEALRHHEHPHLVADVHLPRRGHVVGRADRVAPHVLQEAHLAAERRAVERRAERAEVVVQAYAPELPHDAVEPEPLRRRRNRADAEARRAPVPDAPRHDELGDERVEVRRLGRPEARRRHVEDARHLRQARGVARNRRDRLPVRTAHRPPQLGLLRRSPQGLRRRHARPRGRQRRRPHEGSPRLQSRLRTRHERDGPVEPRPRIPPRAFGDVPQMDRERIRRLAGLQETRDVNGERIVAERPETGLLPVDVDARLGHRAVEDEFRVFRPLRHGERAAVPALAQPREGSRASRLLGRLRLAVLHDAHGLLVDLPVERPRDGPVVRHAHGLPRRVVERRRLGAGRGPAVEAPADEKRRLARPRAEGEEAEQGTGNGHQGHRGFHAPDYSTITDAARGRCRRSGRTARPSAGRGFRPA